MKLTELARMVEADKQHTQAERKHVACRSQIECTDVHEEQISDYRVKNPQTTLTVDAESPLPGGLAKGVWKGRPIVPATK
jgi:hypothetical protein